MASPFMSALAKMQAQVDKFKGLVTSGRPKRKTEEVSDTLKDCKRGTAVNSSVNWHILGGTSLATGGPVNVEGRDAMVREAVSKEKQRALGTCREKKKCLL